MELTVPSAVEIRGRVLDFERLSRLSDHSQWREVHTALDRLAGMGVEPFPDLLADVSDSREDRPLRWALALILGRTGDPQAIEALCKLLYDEYPSVQNVAAFALGQFADPRAVDALIGALAIRKDPKTLREAATALARIGDPRSLPPLSETCEQVSSAGWGGRHTPQVLADCVAELRRKLGLEP